MNLTCFKILGPDQQTAGGIGQGGGLYWQEAVGRMLQQEIAKIMDVPLEECPRAHGKDSYDRTDFFCPTGPFEIVYLQLFECPVQRPDGWIYTLISDYIGLEELLEEFLDRVRPNVVISLQYPLDPPPQITTVPHISVPNLMQQCAKYDVPVVYLPWFNAIDVGVYRPDKNVQAMCTGKMSGTYPFRDAAYKYLENWNRPGIILSGNPTGSTFRLSDEEYHEALARCKYYISGGIYDLQIPPKYYEVCNYGACLVSPEMPMMEASGFVDGETYIKVESVDDLPRLIGSDRWKEVAPKGQEMVRKRHSLHARAQDIVNLYRKMVG